MMARNIHNNEVLVNLAKNCFKEIKVVLNYKRQYCSLQVLKCLYL